MYRFYAPMQRFQQGKHHRNKYVCMFSCNVPAQFLLGFVVASRCFKLFVRILECEIQQVNLDLTSVSCPGKTDSRRSSGTLRESVRSDIFET